VRVHLSAERRVAGVVFLVALVPRLAVPWTGAGLGGSFGYDGGVYYAAADALLHGRLPYADYTLLHPPGIVLALTPFAWLGTVTTDHTGYMVAITAFAVLGALNAALVARLANRLGWGHRGALAGGLAYALWYGALGAEFGVRLEPLGNFLLLLGLHALVRAEGRPGRRWPLLAGVAIGAALATKIWWTVPAAVVLAALLASPSRRRRAAWYTAGVAVGVTAVAGPFFAAAPGPMWRLVVLDQLNRPRNRHELWRLARITGLGQLGPGLPPVTWYLMALVGVAVAAAGCAAAWRAPYGRVVVALALIQLGVLLVAPTYYEFYDDYLGVALGLVAGAALRERVAARAPAGRWQRVGAAAAVAGLVAVDVVAPTPPTRPFPVAALRPAVAGVRCVMSNTPSALIYLDVLSSGLAHHCPQWVDVAGRLYGPDATGSSRPHAGAGTNARWQRDLTRYLLAGQRVVLFWPGQLVGPALGRRLARSGVVARRRHVVVYR